MKVESCVAAVAAAVKTSFEQMCEQEGVYTCHYSGSEHPVPSVLFIVIRQKYAASSDGNPAVLYYSTNSKELETAGKSWQNKTYIYKKTTKKVCFEIRD